jgi:hypothetical protein
MTMLGITTLLVLLLEEVVVVVALVVVLLVALALVLALALVVVLLTTPHVLYERSRLLNRVSKSPLRHCAMHWSGPLWKPRAVKLQ